MTKYKNNKIVNPLYFFIRHFYFLNDLFIENNIKKLDKKDKVILDAGAGDARLKKYFKNAKYLSLDMKQNNQRNIDIICDLNDKISLKNNTVDAIFCIQVLEHIKNPFNLFGEMHRVLKKGGRLILTTNFLYEIHMEPNDFFRFTKYGLQELAIKNGFRVVAIRPQGGAFHTLFYLFINLPTYIFIRRNSFFYNLYYIVFFIPFSILGIFVYFLDFLDREKITTINYECEFRKI